MIHNRMRVQWFSYVVKFDQMNNRCLNWCFNSESKKHSQYCTSKTVNLSNPFTPALHASHSRVKSNCSNLFLKSSAYISSCSRVGLHAFQSTRSGMFNSCTPAITSLKKLTNLLKEESETFKKKMPTCTVIHIRPAHTSMPLSVVFYLLVSRIW